MDERREFLKKIAKGTLYVSPMIYTLSTPRDLMANVTSGMIMFGMLTADADSQPPGSEPPGSVPPGSDPPGSEPPGSQPPGSQPPGGGSDG